MKTDIVLVGVGGQGVLTVGAILAGAALRVGLHVKQGEVHGMAQRGGTVQANLRLADHPIHSDLVPESCADLLLGMEPLETLRMVGYLAPGGVVVTAAEPFKNIVYPSIESIHERVRGLPHAHLIEADRLAREAGSPRAVNVVMVGAASPWVPVAPDAIEAQVREHFARKGKKVVEASLRAFQLGRETVACART